MTVDRTSWVPGWPVVRRFGTGSGSALEWVAPDSRGAPSVLSDRMTSSRPFAPARGARTAVGLCGGSQLVDPLLGAQLIELALEFGPLVIGEVDAQVLKRDPGGGRLPPTGHALFRLVVRLAQQTVNLPAGWFQLSDPAALLRGGCFLDHLSTAGVPLSSLPLRSRVSRSEATTRTSARTPTHNRAGEHAGHRRRPRSPGDSASRFGSCQPFSDPFGPARTPVLINKYGSLWSLLKI